MYIYIHIYIYMDGESRDKEGDYVGNPGDDICLF